MEAMKAFYQKLHKVDEDGNRGTAYYRAALFRGLCSSSSAPSHTNISEKGVDHLCCNKSSSLALEEIPKLNAEAPNVMFCLTLVCFDALFTSMMEGFGTFVDECKSQRSCILLESAEHSATLCNSAVEDVASCETRAIVEKPISKLKKGGRVPVVRRK